MSISPFELQGIKEYLDDNCDHSFVMIITCETREKTIECEYCGKSKLEIILSKLQDIEGES